MGLADTAPDALVDLERYPVFDAGSAPYRAVVERARHELAAVGAAELPGFVGPAGVPALVADAESLVPRAHRSGGKGTAYLELPEGSYPDGHPRTTWGDYALGAVAYDLFPLTSPLRRIYEWTALTDLVATILDRGPLFPYADPFGALNLAVMGPGDQLQWHFDQTDFVVSLAIQAAEGGGEFEVAPRIRAAGDERYDDVAAVLGGDHAPVLTLSMEPGTLLVFEGRHSLHRVSPVEGDRLRHVGLLAYDTKPGTMGSELLHAVRYGRTEALASPPEHWPRP